MDRVRPPRLVVESHHQVLGGARGAGDRGGLSVHHHRHAALRRYAVAPADRVHAHRVGQSSHTSPPMPPPGWNWLALSQNRSKGSNSSSVRYWAPTEDGTLSSRRGSPSIAVTTAAAHRPKRHTCSWAS